MMDFQTALTLIKSGRCVARTGWNGMKDGFAGSPPMFLFLVKGSEFEVNRGPLNQILPNGTRVTYRPHIDLKATDGSIGPWHPSGTDLMAEDWVEVASPNQQAPA